MPQETNGPSCFLLQDGILLLHPLELCAGWLEKPGKLLCSVELFVFIWILFETSVDSWKPIRILKNNKNTEKSTDSTNLTTQMILAMAQNDIPYYIRNMTPTTFLIIRLWQGSKSRYSNPTFRRRPRVARGLFVESFGIFVFPSGALQPELVGDQFVWQAADAH